MFRGPGVQATTMPEGNDREHDGHHRQGHGFGGDDAPARRAHVEIVLTPGRGVKAAMNVPTVPRQVCPGRCLHAWCRRGSNPVVAADPVRAAGVRTPPPVHDRPYAQRGTPGPRMETVGRGRGECAPEGPRVLTGAGRCGHRHRRHRWARRSTDLCDGSVRVPLRQVFTRWDARGVPTAIGCEEIAPWVSLFPPRRTSSRWP